MSGARTGLDVSVDMGTNIVADTILVLTAPIWLPALGVMHLKDKLARKRGRQVEDQYLKTRDKMETVRVEPFPRIAALEKKSGRSITIDTTTSKPNLAKCHPQKQSPLFVLPAELRMMIFELVLSEKESPPDEDKRRVPYATAKPVCGVNILQTCRMVWLEANSLANVVSEPVLWLVDPYLRVYGSFHDLRTAFREYFRRLSIINAAKLQSLRIVCPLSWLHYPVLRELMALAPVPLPQALIITFWDVGHASTSLPVRLFDPDNRGWRNVAAAGVSRLEMDVVAQSGDVQEVDFFLQQSAMRTLLGGHGNQPGWHVGQNPDWAPFPDRDAFPNSDCYVKSFEWNFVGQLGSSYIPHRASRPQTGDASTKRQELVTSTIERWRAENSLLRFV